MERYECPECGLVQSEFDAAILQEKDCRYIRCGDCLYIIDIEQIKTK